MPKIKKYVLSSAGALLVAVGALILEGLAVLVERLADPMRAAKRQGT